MTTWLWSAGAVFGALLVLLRVADESSVTVVGSLIALLGLVIVAVGTGLTAALHEPPDVTEVTDGPTTSPPEQYHRAH